MEVFNSIGLITEAQLAQMMKVEESTCRAWRYRGMAPAWSKVGNQILYRVKDVEVFIAERTRPGGTTQLKGIL
jgi:hypothetical protein